MFSLACWCSENDLLFCPLFSRQRDFANTRNTARGCHYSSNHPTKKLSLFLEKSELKPNPIFSAIELSSLLQLRILRYHDGIDLGFAFHIWLD